ncbi:ABC transporter substrate-binding protein [Thermoflavimicrobium dichotomicum]|uniref:Iron complex transport system substrate-binding protein n=1 Tax=Thermoflavimicrobium dichotomicum TaxID=46223 RepID=A0A1I3LT00_9BACL|nr:iron-siderophore ABC transporter substrate-binding protein [Thermoflavimicrobium dichotomicum]SFI87827.1 iron complex transport system substrate-binding protein [Thermoflavimicrobium dichotomicum]
MLKRHRLFGLFTLLMVFSLIVAACSSAPGADSSKSEAQKGKTRTIEHVMGKTEVPETPKRVVVLTNEGIEALLALGVKPVGAVEGFTGGWYPHIAKEMEGVTSVGTEHQPNLEAIAKLKPDLIIGMKMRQEKVYKQLSAIAPTVFSDKLRGDWKENFKLYAKTVNKEAEGQKLIAAFDKKVEEVKKKAGDLTKKKISIVRFMPGKVRIYQGDTFTGVIFKQLGWARPELQAKNEFAVEVTRERIPDMDGDILLYFTYTPKKDGDSALKLEKEFTNDPLWKNLNAVKNQQVFKVDDIIWNTAGGIKAANLMLDELSNKYIPQFKK